MTQYWGGGNETKQLGGRVSVKQYQGGGGGGGHASSLGFRHPKEEICQISRL